VFALKVSLNRNVLTQEIYNLLKEQILSHTLPPGDKINIDQIARDLDVSNIPIREALSRLTAEGLVRMVPFKGMFVTEISLQELDEIFEIRIPLEVLAVRKATRSIPAAEIEKALKDMNRLRKEASKGKTKGLDILVEMNERIHGMILRYSDNQILRDLIQMHRERIERYFAISYQEIQPDTLEVECLEHNTILEHLQKGDVAGAETAMQEHLISSHKRTREIFTANGAVK
jgi:DNA-binding GntR family transcriptional regulator